MTPSPSSSPARGEEKRESSLQRGEGKKRFWEREKILGEGKRFGKRKVILGALDGEFGCEY